MSGDPDYAQNPCSSQFNSCNGSAGAQVARQTSLHIMSGRGWGRRFGGRGAGGREMFGPPAVDEEGNKLTELIQGPPPDFPVGSKPNNKILLDIPII